MCVKCDPGPPGVPGELEKLSVERLGLAYSRLKCLEWDEILGRKPDGFDDLTNNQKGYYVGPACAAIESILSEATCSRYLRRFKPGQLPGAKQKGSLSEEDLDAIHREIEETLRRRHPLC